MLTPGSKLVLATRNSDKIIEIKDILRRLNLEIITVADFGNVPEVIEDGNTIEANAVKKAKIVAQATGLPALADDTALEVDALGGEPGVRSSRYAGENVSYTDNVRLLLERLQGVPLQHRTARFCCVMALVSNGEIKTVEGRCEGVIWHEARGQNGFGYDPVFYVPKYKQTFAEMPLKLKNKISHRGEALNKVRKVLANIPAR